ncbi:hypothetical protein Tco_1345241 [Tanacetum coccineum]
MVIVGGWGTLGRLEVSLGGGVWSDIARFGREIDGVGIEFTSACVGLLGDGRDGINKWYQSLCSETLIKKLQTRRTLYSIKEMDLETTQNNVVAKLPLLKQGDYEMWKLRIEQYFQVQDYALWEVIEYGNSFKPVARTTTNTDGTSTSTILGPVTTEEKA